MAGSARELFREYGCSERVYKDAFNPMLLVELFAPGELCSAAACLGMLYYFILAHQVCNSILGMKCIEIDTIGACAVLYYILAPPCV